MTTNLKKCLYIVFALILPLAMIVFIASANSVNGQVTGLPETFKDIPGITEEEIQAVENALALKSSFMYGMSNGVECFYRDDGSIGGYGVLVCNWLSKFFGVPFTLTISSRGEIGEELSSGKYDFSGDFAPMSSQKSKFIVSDTIDLRIIKYARLKGGLSLEAIASERPVRYGFIKNSNSYELVKFYLYRFISFNSVIVSGYNEALEKLRNGEMDIFIADDSLINSFLIYNDLEMGQFTPLFFKDISIVTANPELKPMIDVLNRFFAAGGLSHLHELYVRGAIEFNQNAFISSLNDTELAYYNNCIQTQKPILYCVTPDEYPIQYYDKNKKQWAGISVDVLNEISKFTGLTFQPTLEKNMNSSKINDILAIGDIPMAADLPYSPEREAEFLWADKPYIQDHFALVSRTDFYNIDIGQMLFHKTGLTQDSPSLRWFPNSNNAVIYTNTLEGLNALKRNQIDLLVTTENLFTTITNNMQLSGLKINMLYNDTASSSFGFNIQERTLRNIISKAQVLVDIDRIANSWRNNTFDYQAQLAHTQRAFMIWLMVMLCIIIILFAWMFSIRTHQAKSLSKMVAERTQELKEQTEATQAASMAKTNFLATMSHEMRTPMNAVIGFSEVLLRESESINSCNGECRHNLVKIHRAGLTLLSIINDILDISKIESGKLEIIPEKYDTAIFINDTVSLNISRIGDKPIKFVLEVDENLPKKLWGDELRIKQICTNLLSNAFKYTKTGTVTWSIDCEKEAYVDDLWVIITVRDTGMGIRKEDINKLFTDFGQLDTKSNRRIEGTGLGLSLTKRMAEMMGGSVNVISEYGKGSEFVVRIRQKSVSDAVIGPKVAEDLKNFQYSEGDRLTNVRLPKIRLPYAKVLIVDDVLANLEVAKGLMKPYGMQVDLVTRGAEAIEAIRLEKVKYSAIFMDHMMPEMDGVEATRVIREDIGTEYAKNIPIIMLSANAIVGNEEIFLSQGFQAFLSKPIDNIRLDSVIRQWVRDKELEKSLMENQKTDHNGQTHKQNNEAQVHETQKKGESAGTMENQIIEDKFIEYNNVGALSPNLTKREINGLDLEAAFETFGDEETVMDILNVFASDTPSLLDQMRNVTRDNLHDYTVIVHGIKGSCRGIFAEPMAQKAERLEHEAKAGNFDYVKAENSPFIKGMESLLAELTDFLGGTGESMKKTEPDRDILAALLDASENFDIDGVAKAMAELESHEYETGDELIKWLRESLKTMNFGEIAQRLSQTLT